MHFKLLKLWYLNNKKSLILLGLDPAGPLIEKHGSTKFRLTKDDADVVQIVHTNAGFLGQGVFSGTVDICVNGGREQPYCRGDTIRKARCSHFLSVCYLANAIFKRKQSMAIRCPQGCVKRNRWPFIFPLFQSSINGISMRTSEMTSFVIGEDLPEK